MRREDIAGCSSHCAFSPFQGRDDSPTSVLRCVSASCPSPCRDASSLVGISEHQAHGCCRGAGQAPLHQPRLSCLFPFIPEMLSLSGGQGVPNTGRGSPLPPSALHQVPALPEQGASGRHGALPWSLLSSSCVTVDPVSTEVTSHRPPASSPDRVPATVWRSGVGTGEDILLLGDREVPRSRRDLPCPVRHLSDLPKAAPRPSARCLRQSPGAAVTKYAARGLGRTDVSSLTVLEATRSLRRLWGGSFLPLPASGAPGIPGLVAASLQPLPHLQLASPLCVSLPLTRPLVAGFRAQQIITSAETIFPSKVAPAGSGP